MIDSLCGLSKNMGWAAFILTVVCVLLGVYGRSSRKSKNFHKVLVKLGQKNRVIGLSALIFGLMHGALSLTVHTVLLHYNAGLWAFAGEFGTGLISVLGYVPPTWHSFSFSFYQTLQFPVRWEKPKQPKLQFPMRWEKLKPLVLKARRRPWVHFCIMAGGYHIVVREKYSMYVMMFVILGIIFVEVLAWKSWHKKKKPKVT